MKNTKTLAELKRDAKSGKVYMEMIERFGSTDIPDKLKGKRQMVDANTVCVKFLNNDGKKSELRIDAASLIEYTDTELTTYLPGLRDLTSAEKDVMDSWESKRDKRQEEIDMLTDGSTSFYRHKHFFIDAGFEYLLGYNTKQGKKYDFNTKKVRDNKVKGDVELKYKIVI